MQTKHPKGLYLLFFTELWERFGFYALQSIIILYMTKALLFSDQKSYLLYGTFSSMIYLTPVLGGYIADKYLGYQRAIIIGGVLLILGYLITSIPDERFLFLGLSVLIMGNGFFKPNVSSIVGDLYRKDDPKREGGFTLFYMGINLGSLFPPLIAGAIVTYYGWHAGFLVAAIGIAVGLTIFILGRKLLRTAGEIPATSKLKKSRANFFSFYASLIALIFLGIGFFRLLFGYPYETTLFLSIMGALIVSFLIIDILKEDKEQRNKMIACLVLILISIGFWAVYNQTYTSLMLFADRNMTKEVLGMKIDTEFMQFFNPFFIIALSPMLSQLWVKLAKTKNNPTTPTKFAFGTFFLSIGFFFLVLGIRYFSHDGETSPWWLIGSYFLQTIGELFLSPIGLSMITILSPKRLVGMMMGIWFLTISAAFAIGASLASVSSVPQTATATASLSIYENAFQMYGIIAFLVSVLSFLLIPFLKKLIHGSPPMNPIK